VGTSPRVLLCLTISHEIQRTRTSLSHLFLKSIHMAASMMSSACTRFCFPDSRSAFANHKLAAFVVSVFHRIHSSDSVTSSVCIQWHISIALEKDVHDLDQQRMSKDGGTQDSG
jgi:hypothetical protein